MNRTPSRALAFGLVACLSALASNARAQDPQGSPPRPAEPALVPPKLIASEPPEYPEGATDAASVLVDMVVERDGSVSRAEIVTHTPGHDAFEAAAVFAAERYRFEPATRGGKRVRARVRALVTFTPPEVVPKPKAETSAPQAAGVAAAAAQPFEGIREVEVAGVRTPKSPTEYRLGRAEVRMIPGAFGDPFRAIDILPGVVPIVSGLPYFYIRGAPPSAVGYYVDEVRVPYLFHFGLGPGVIQPALIDEVALHPAAFPARFGRFAGGIVAGKIREPQTGLHGEGQIRLYDAGAYAEGSFANGRATVGIGGRYSYTAGLISLFAPNVTIDYRDYNARASYKLTDRWRASVLTFGSFDYTSDVKQGKERVLFASEFHRVDVRFDHRGADGSTTRIATTLGLDRTRIEAARFAQSFLLGVRARHRWPLGPKADMELGADLTADRYTGDLPSPYAVTPSEYAEAVTFFSPRMDTATGAWLSATVRPYARWEVTATARADIFTSAGKVGFGPSPRLSTRIPLTAKLAFLSAMGISPQPPAFALPVPAIGYSGLPGGLMFAYQKSAGLEVVLPWRFNLKAMGFHHTYFNVRDFSQNRDDIDPTSASVTTHAPNQAFGLETFLARKLSERYSLFTSLTLMRSELGSTPTSPATVAAFDRTYVFQLGGAADLGRGWKASARFLTYGGWPVQPSPDTPHASGRLSAFRRVDARVEKRWNLGAGRWVAFVIEGLNVTGSKDTVASRCIGGGSSTDPSSCSEDTFGPVVIPSLGVEGGL